MDNLSLKSQSKRTKEHIEVYVENEITRYKLLLAESLSKLAMGFLSAIVIVSLLLIFSGFIGISMALWIGNMMENFALGFLIVGGFFVAAAIFIWLMRKPIFAYPILRKLIQVFK